MGIHLKTKYWKIYLGQYEQRIMGIHLFTGKLKIEIFNIFTFSSNSEFTLAIICKCYEILAQYSRTKSVLWSREAQILIQPSLALPRQ